LNIVEGAMANIAPFLYPHVIARYEAISAHANQKSPICGRNTVGLYSLR